MSYGTTRTCPECQETVNRKAKRCPYCSAKIVTDEEKFDNFMSSTVGRLVILFVIVAAVIASCGA